MLKKKPVVSKRPFYTLLGWTVWRYGTKAAGKAVAKAAPGKQPKTHKVRKLVILTMFIAGAAGAAVKLKSSSGGELGA